MSDSTSQLHKRAGADARTLVFCVTALSLVFMYAWVLNAEVLPALDPLSPGMRDALVGAKAVTLVAVAIAAGGRYREVLLRSLVGVSLLSIVLGIAGYMAALFMHSTGLHVFGAFASSIGASLAAVVVGVACLSLSLPVLGAAVAGAYVLSFAWRALFAVAAVSEGYMVAPLICIIAVLLVHRPARSGLACISASPSSPDAALAQPNSFLSMLNQIFVCMLVFRVVYGLALTAGETLRIPVDSSIVFAPLAAAFLYALFCFARRRSLDADFLFYAASLCVVAGLSLFQAESAFSEGFVNAFLYTGSALFDMLSWYVLVALGSRNHAMAIKAFAWGSAMKAFGSIAGAFLGRAMNAGALGPIDRSVLVAVTTVAFVSYVVHFASTFRITRTIACVEPVQEISVSHAVPDETFEARCAAVAAEFSLTPREAEVFELLARGRNGNYIKDALTISYNTVKTHVAHVYDKAGVHSQQELIDLVVGAKGF